MGDPSVYATARGKNKKQKLGNRMDAKNNKANKLMNDIQAETMKAFSAPIERREMGQRETLAKKGAEKMSAERTRLLRLLEESRTVHCSNLLCPTRIREEEEEGEEGEGPRAPRVLYACKGCKVAKYCDTKCQRIHWPEHKEPCKAMAAQLADAAKTALETGQRVPASTSSSGGGDGGAAATSSDEEEEDDDEDDGALA